MSSKSAWKFGPGVGYALRAANSFSLTLTGAIPYRQSNHPVPVHLKAGWNLIGIPERQSFAYEPAALMVRYPGSSGLSQKESLTAATGTGLIASGVYSVAPGTWAYTLLGSGATLYPGQAYWIEATGDCELMMP